MTRRTNSRSAFRRDMSLMGDVSDAELLAIVDDQKHDGGWTSTYDVRVTLGENVEDPGRSGVGPRLSWLRRYGWLTQNKFDRSLWRLSPAGEALLDHPNLTRQLERALAKLTPAQRLRLTRELGEVANVAVPEIRQALRRQWTRSLGVRR